MTNDFPFYEVTWPNLSSLTHSVHLSEDKDPHVKIVKFAGIYRPNEMGRGDASYIRATYQAAHEAWFTPITVLDFSDLDFQGGEEMESIFSLGWNPSLKRQWPLVVVVGHQCRRALRSLVPDKYPEYCRNSLEDAIELGKQKNKQLTEFLVRNRKRGVG